MKTIGMIAILIVGSGLAQQPGVNRTDLQRHDLSIPGREAVQVRVDIGPGTTSSLSTNILVRRSFMFSKAR